MTISQKIIKELQQVTGFSINRLAKESGIPRSTLAAIHRGVNSELSTASAVRLFRLLAEKAPKQRFFAVMLKLFSEIDEHDGTSS